MKPGGSEAIVIGITNKEVREAILETEGQTSILKKDSNKPVRKKERRRFLR